MLVELWERFGQPLDWWLDQPVAFHHWLFGQMQEIDRRRDWIERRRAIDRAWLTARAFHDHESLNDVDRAHIASAAPSYADEVALVRGAAMAADLERGRTLEGLA